MRFRAHYPNRDPDVVPENVNFKLPDLEERRTWWRGILPARTFGDLWAFFEAQPADIRNAGQVVLQCFLDEPHTRLPAFFEIYRYQAHLQRRLDKSITSKLERAAEKQLELAEKQVIAGTRVRASLIPLKAAHDQFKLARLMWERGDDVPSNREDRSGRHVPIRRIGLGRVSLCR